MERSLTYIEKLVDFVFIEVAIYGFNICKVFLANANSVHLCLNTFLVCSDSAAHFYLEFNFIPI